MTKPGETSVRRETKPPISQSAGKLEEDKRRTKDSKRSGGSSRLQGQSSSHKELSSKRSSERDRGHRTDTKNSREKVSGTKTKDKKRSEPAKIEKSRDNKKTVAQEEVTQKENAAQDSAGIWNNIWNIDQILYLPQMYFTSVILNYLHFDSSRF